MHGVTEYVVTTGLVRGRKYIFRGARFVFVMFLCKFERNFSGHNKILGRHDKVRRALRFNAPHHGYGPGISGDMAIT